MNSELRRTFCIGLGSSLGSTSVEDIDLIELVNDLQNKLAASGSSLNITLPQIVVVGSQSSGKSSVLENFVGKEFLPRGKGVVTRRPTIIQLTPSDKEYAIFSHKSDVVFTDFQKVKEEIEAETLRDPGPYEFSDKPISLKIFSPNVLKLSVVDLPGLIKNATQSQSQEAIDTVRNMVMKYITPKESLILAISPANQDIANSHSLNIARIVDPERERTFGVLTKLDLVDEGNDARDVLENTLIPLQRGYVGVVNRSQKEIDDNRDMNYILEKESSFFAEHPSYSHMAKRMGTKYLQRLLHKHLKAHIRSTLPRVRNDIIQKQRMFQKELKELNELMGEGLQGREYYMLKLIQRFINDMEMKIMGQSEMVDKKTISAGALINNILYTSVPKLLNLNLEPNKEESALIIVNICGIRTSISIPSLAVEAVARDLIELYKNPLESAVDLITEVLMSAISEAAFVLNRYPTFKNELEFRLQICVEQAAENTKDRLNDYIEAEMSYVNLRHPNLDRTTFDAAVPVVGPLNVWNEKSSAEENIAFKLEKLKDELKNNEDCQKSVEYITLLLKKYLEIVRKQVGDIVIKYIVKFLVKRVLKFLKEELISLLVGSGSIKTLMQDCDEEYRRQEELTAICKSLGEALEAIRHF